MNDWLKELENDMKLKSFLLVKREVAHGEAIPMIQTLIFDSFIGLRI